MKVFYLILMLYIYIYVCIIFISFNINIIDRSNRIILKTKKNFDYSDLWIFEIFWMFDIRLG